MNIERMEIRQLKRERARAQAELLATMRQRDEAVDALQQARRERDEALAVCKLLAAADGAAAHGAPLDDPCNEKAYSLLCEATDAACAIVAKYQEEIVQHEMSKMR